MSIRLIRQDSDTPNVTNHDDARMVRYAYGGYDGYIKNRGQEIGYSISGTTFIVQSGVLNLQGWEVEIDANGAGVSIDNTATKRYFSVYLEVNCGTDSAQIKSLYDTAGYPSIPESDDLTKNTIGIARLLLYHFTATSGVIADVEKMVEPIDYMDEFIEQINQRLDEMGFKEATAADGGIQIQEGWAAAKYSEWVGPGIFDYEEREGNRIKKLGKFVILEDLSVKTGTKISADYNATFGTNGKAMNYYYASGGGEIANIPTEYRPKTDIFGYATVSIPKVGDVYGTLTVTKEGTIKLEVRSSIYVRTSPVSGGGVINNENPSAVFCKSIGWDLR